MIELAWIGGAVLGAGFAGVAVYMAHHGLRQTLQDLKAQWHASQDKITRLEEALRLESSKCAVLRRARRGLRI